MQQYTKQHVIKILDRLPSFIDKINPTQSISPIYHAVSVIQKYGLSQKQITIKQLYFHRFYEIFEDFAKSDFSSIKKNHQKILDEIAGIVQSQEFISCLKPNFKKSRNLRNSLRISKIETIQLYVQQYHIDSDYIKTIQYGDKLTHQSLNESQSIIDELNQKLSFNVQQKKLKQVKQKQQAKQKYQRLQMLLKQIHRSYEQHNLDIAYEKCIQYKNYIKPLCQMTQQTQRFLEKLCQQYQLMCQFYSQFDKGTWTFDKQQDGITLQYKIYQKQNMIAIRIVGEGDIPIEPFLSIISQIDLMGDYVPFCYDCKQVKKISRNQRIGTSKIYIPVLNDRETYFYAAGYDRIKTKKSLFFFSKTINEDLQYQEKYDCPVPKQGEYVRLQYKFFIVEYIPITSKRARIRLSSKVDMKMNYLPSFIIFKSARIFAFDYFKNIIDRIKNYKGSAWQKKVQQNPAMYKFFHNKLQQYFTN